uniref:Uncharacterized protein n=1 Tax=viral metagenome TaxID=1070528 RepID=A0A6C0BM31_9ZZZZ
MTPSELLKILNTIKRVDDIASDEQLDKLMELINKLDPDWTMRDTTNKDDEAPGYFILEATIPRIEDCIDILRLGFSVTPYDDNNYDIGSPPSEDTLIGLGLHSFHQLYVEYLNDSRLDDPSPLANVRNCLSMRCKPSSPQLNMIREVITDVIVTLPDYEDATELDIELFLKDNPKYIPLHKALINQ